MNLDDIAKTRAAAEAQEFTMPEYDRWTEFAHLIDGYAICEDMGVRWQDWHKKHADILHSNPDTLTTLDLRMLFFFLAWSDRFWAGIEPYVTINNYLRLISYKSGKPYTPLTDEEIEQRIKREEAMLLRGFQQPDGDSKSASGDIGISDDDDLFSGSKIFPPQDGEDDE